MSPLAAILKQKVSKMQERPMSSEERDAKRVSKCKACRKVTYKDGMTVCNLARKKTYEMRSCPEKQW